MQRGLALFEQLGDEHGRADCWTTLGAVAGERGDLTASAWRCRSARRLAAELGLGQVDALATLGQAYARLRAGRLRAVAALLDHAQDVATSCGLRLETTQAVLMRAELLLRGTAAGQGIADAMQATAGGGHGRSRPLRGPGRGQGTLGAAQAAAGEGLRLATEGGYRREEALVQRLLGRCAAVRAMPAEAQSHFHAALAIQMEMGATLEADRTQLAMADALTVGAEEGDVPPEAYKLLAQARESFLAAGVAWDLGEAKRMAATWELEAKAHGTA